MNVLMALRFVLPHFARVRGLADKPERMGLVNPFSNGSIQGQHGFFDGGPTVTEHPRLQIGLHHALLSSFSPPTTLFRVRPAYLELEEIPDVSDDAGS